MVYLAVFWQRSNKQKGSFPMTTDDNKALVQRFFEEVINQRNVAALDQFVPAGGGVNHTVPAGMPQQASQMLGLYLAAFPDAQATVEDLLADGDKVVARVSITGTHQGAFRGIVPTGKPITVMGVHIFRVANGKLVEHWGLMDRHSALQQLGVVLPLAPVS
jgi:predicted ester cyclase